MCILSSIPLLRISKTFSRSHSANRCAGSHDGDRIDTGPGPSAGEDREDQWAPQEAEAGHEEDKKEETEGNGERDDGDKPLLLRSTKKRPLSSAKEKRRVKRRVKRRRFSSPFSSDEDTVTGTSWTSAAIHLPDPTVPQSPDPPLLTRPALRELQMMMLRWGL